MNRIRARRALLSVAAGTAFVGGVLLGHASPASTTEAGAQEQVRPYQECDSQGNCWVDPCAETKPGGCDSVTERFATRGLRGVA